MNSDAGNRKYNACTLGSWGLIILQYQTFATVFVHQQNTDTNNKLTFTCTYLKLTEQEIDVEAFLQLSDEDMGMIAVKLGPKAKLIQKRNMLKVHTT